MTPANEEFELDEELLSVCRTAVGDELRSITYFTHEDVDQLYLRSDLDPDANLEGFAEHERLGFRSQEAYENTELGEYEATIRMFEYGYLTRVVHDGHGVWVTTDDMSIDRFEELSVAVRNVLSSFEAVDA
ncbi:DUF7522 family protein [Natranaeroarchaeum aerophilus]|uniref:Uncharacterized protein n=1 Tax=Natranaeroarchaeum aerophilus TaxID=2917711 RepID=A0AAE3K6F2_9EURY|nr:hypothetical protein [Natranaeroarchaeum aerophilus]MCL9814933.1 hypothetical protein [Natranaeroarchaeum aerophilus]